MLSITYAAVLVLHGGGLYRDISSLEGVAALFRQRAALVAGWIHYLAFDMLIGVMLARRMMEERMPRVLMLIVLPLTFFLGPVGFVAYQLIRGARYGLSSSQPAPKRARRTSRPAKPSHPVRELTPPGSAMAATNRTASIP